ncbi:BnaC04g53130D [Brassica napus]|uniref:BnaC04g53130D protein n=1 Tax=Brassica napus TaxID=3708 RepID=A0A078IPE5_BRANA|nr:BnaC04g53130D [Brassica napus]
MRGAVATEATEVVVVRESTENTMEEFPGVDFLVVDSKRRDNKGAVLVCKNAAQRAASGFKWQDVLNGGTRVARSVFLPVGNGLDIAHVGAIGGHQRGESRKHPSRWIRHVDHLSGEEHLFRR